MMSVPEGSAHLATRNHLLVTDTITARGTVWPCRGRLADHLRDVARGMITVRDVEVTERSKEAEVEEWAVEWEEALEAEAVADFLIMN